MLNVFMFCHKNFSQRRWAMKLKAIGLVIIGMMLAAAMVVA